MRYILTSEEKRKQQSVIYQFALALKVGKKFTKLMKLSHH